MARTGTHTKWLPEEDLYCVNRFIENYFERLIKIGKPIESKEMELEIDLYNQYYNNKRTEASVKMKFHNIEYLSFQFVEKNGNPHKIKIKKGLSKKSKQCLKYFEIQVEKYSKNINKWLAKNN